MVWAVWEVERGSLREREGAAEDSVSELGTVSDCESDSASELVKD